VSLISQTFSLNINNHQNKLKFNSTMTKTKTCCDNMKHIQHFRNISSI